MKRRVEGYDEVWNFRVQQRLHNLAGKGRYKNIYFRHDTLDMILRALSMYPRHDGMARISYVDCQMFHVHCPGAVFRWVESFVTSSGTYFTGASRWE